MDKINIYLQKKSTKESANVQPFTKLYTHKR